MKARLLNKNIILILCLIIVVALGFRIAIIVAVPKISRGGAQVYHAELARNLAAGRGFVIDEEYLNTLLATVNEVGYVPDIENIKPPENEVFINAGTLPPGTALLLAGTYRVFGGHQFIYLRIVQAIIDSLGCLFLFLIGKELFSIRIGFICSFLYAFWVPIAYISTWPVHDALMPFITSVCFYLFIMAVRKKSMMFYAISGLVAGIGCYFQPTLLLLPVAFGAGLFIYGLRDINLKENVVSVGKTTIIMMATLMVVVAPWIIRNTVVTGDLSVGMRGELWQGIWEGFGEVDNPFGAVLDDAITHQQLTKELGYDPGSFTPATQEIFKEKVITAIEENPGWYVSTLLRRVPRTFVYFDQIMLEQVPGTDNTPWYAEKSWISFITGTGFISAFKNGAFTELVNQKPRVVLYLTASWFFAVVPFLLSVTGIWILRRKWRILVLVLTLLFYFSVIHIFLFVSFHKTLLPGSLTYIILSAVTLGYFYSRMKGDNIAA
jgi:4-amino-4-deoxy-L-arabinose transferase-like glycosyltransferase